VNATLSRAEYRSRRTVVTARPFGLILDPCNGCTLACPGCVHSVETRRNGLFDWPRGLLSRQRFDNYIERFGPFAAMVKFWNYGEPVLNPHTPEYIRTAKRSLAQTVISSSLSVRHFDADAYVASGLDYFLVSIDGATQSVYERFRRNGDIELVFQNVRKLVEARSRAGSKFPVIAWQYLAFEHNRHEISQAVEKAASLGCNEIRIARPFDVGREDPSIQPATGVEARIVALDMLDVEDYAVNWNRFAGEIDGAAVQRAFEYAWPAAGPDEFPPASDNFTCSWLYTSTVMDSGGRVLPCCCAPAPGQDLVFAHIESDRDLFNSPKHIAAREFFRSGATGPGTPHCAKCTWIPNTPDIDPVHLRHYLAAAGEPEAGEWLGHW